jgi:phospholipase C
VSSAQHPNSSVPSHIDLIHAAKVADLSLRNEQGSYDKHVPPDLSSSAALSDYIQTRTAAWTQHLQRMRKRAGRNALSKNTLVAKGGKAGKSGSKTKKR